MCSETLPEFPFPKTPQTIRGVSSHPFSNRTRENPGPRFISLVVRGAEIYRSEAYRIELGSVEINACETCNDV